MSQNWRGNLSNNRAQTDRQKKVKDLCTHTHVGTI